MDDWDHLRYFLGVIDAGSVSSAARAMAVEHSTVTRRIDALEKNLRLRLFDRLPRGWQLTAEGRALVVPARRIADEVDGLLRAANAEIPLAGTVRVSAPPALASCLLANALPAALSRYPGITLELIGEARNADVMRSETDIALRYRRPEAPGLVARSLTTIGYGLYASQDYTRQRSENDWTFLGFDASLDDAPHALWLQQLAGVRRFAMRSNDLLSLAEAALGGIGVAMLPTYVAAHVRGLERLAVECDVHRKLWLVMHEDVRRSPRVRVTADAVACLFEERAAQL